MTVALKCLPTWHNYLNQFYHHPPHSTPLTYSLNAQYSLTVRQSSSPVASDHHVSIPPHRHQNLVGRVSYNIIFTHHLSSLQKPEWKLYNFHFNCIHDIFTARTLQFSP